MSTVLHHSMLYDVLFPPQSGDEEVDEPSRLALRRIVRHTVGPSMELHQLPLCIFDFETTGLDPRTDRIIEIGALRFYGGEARGEFSTLIDPRMEIEEKITKITGITQDMLVGQPTIEDVLPKFMKFIEGTVLVAHNAEFDMAFLRQACSEQGIDLEWPAFCTLKMARALLPKLERKDLDTLAEHFGLTFESRHRSIGDVKVTASVLDSMLEHEGADLTTWGCLSQFEVN